MSNIHHPEITKPHFILSGGSKKFYLPSVTGLLIPAKAF